MSGLFELTAYGLYILAKEDYKSFSTNPNTNDLFNLLTKLYHLREWIIKGDKYESYKNKEKDDYTLEEVLHTKLHNDSNYKIIGKLCNNSKHFNDNTGISKKSEINNGFKLGINKFGDKFGQNNYLVEGKDIRDIIAEVFKIYEKYFKRVNSSL